MFVIIFVCSLCCERTLTRRAMEHIISSGCGALCAHGFALACKVVDSSGCDAICAREILTRGVVVNFRPMEWCKSSTRGAVE